MNRIRQFVLIVAGLLVLGVTSYAQQITVVATTLAAAVTDPAATTLRVASATGFTAGSTAIYVNREFMTVRAVNGTAISVVRGARGTRGGTHASGTPVFVGPVGNNSPFITDDKAGSCTAASEPYLPQFNITNGKEFDCTGSLWSEIGGPLGTYVTLTLCGDQPNNTTNYNSPIDHAGGLGVQAGTTANDLSYGLTGTGCDAEDNTTEATADEPLFANNAVHVLGLACTSGSAGSNGTILNLRSAAASLTPDITLTIATSTTTGAVSQRTSTRIAAGATFALRQISTEDLSATNIWCQARIQVLP